MLRRTDWLFLSLLSILTVVFIFHFVSKPQLVGWDEADYIFKGYEFNRILKEMNWPELIQLARYQVFYPFFPSWYLGLATLPFGYSINSARLVSLLLFWPMIFLVWFLAKGLSPKDKIAPVLAVGLVITSPTILYFFSTAMREGIALLLTLLSLWLFCQAREKKRFFLFALAGIIVQLVFFTKYNYGLILVAALGLESAIWFLSEKRWAKIKVGLFSSGLFGPIIILSSWWCLLPGNWMVIYPFLVKNVNDFPSSWLQHLLFYPFELAFSYSFSWVAFLFLVVGFVWASITHRCQPKVRSLVLLFLVNFLAMEFKIPFKNQGRYLFTSVPGFFLVGSLGLVELWSRVKKIRLKPMVLGIFLPFVVSLGAILLWDLIRVPMLIRPTGSHHFGGPAFYEPDHQKNTRFNFNRQDWPHQSPPIGTEKIDELFDFAFQNVDLSKEIFQVGTANELSPQLFNYYLVRIKEVNLERRLGVYQKYWVVFEIMPGSLFDTDDFRRANWASALWARGTLTDPNLDLIEQKHFPYLGVRVSVMGDIN